MCKIYIGCFDATKMYTVTHVNDLFRRCRSYIRFETLQIIRKKYEVIPS